MMAARTLFVLSLVVLFAGLRAEAQQVLVYDPGSCHQIGLRAAEELALTDGFAIVLVRTEEEFNTRLTNGGVFDLVVVDNPVNTIVDSQPLIDFVLAGGRCTLAYAQLFNDVALQTAFGVVAVAEFTTPQTIYCWDPMEPIWADPITLTQVDAGDDLELVDGVLLEPLMDATAIGGYTVTELPERAAAVLANDDRTLAIGESLDGLAQAAAIPFAKKGMMRNKGDGCDPIGLTVSSLSCSSVELTYNPAAFNLTFQLEFEQSVDRGSTWSPLTLTPISSNMVQGPPLIGPPNSSYLFRVTGVMVNSVTLLTFCQAEAKETLVCEQPTHGVFRGDGPRGRTDSSGEWIREAEGNCVDYVILESLTSLPNGLSLTADKIIWVFLGTPPGNHVLTAAEGQVLADHVANGGSVYIEGANPWGLDPSNPFSAFDGVEDVGVSDGDDSFIGMVGLAHGGLDLTGFDAAYFQDSCDDDVTDQLIPSLTDVAGSDAGSIWIDDTTGGGSGYTTGVYYDTDLGYGKVISQSWEFGGYQGDRTALFDAYVAALKLGGCPPVTALSCDVVGDDVQMFWVVDVEPDSSLEILRDGTPIATLPTGASDYLDVAPGPGTFTYEVVSTCAIGSVDSVSCQVEIDAGTEYVRGDCNTDGAVNIADAIGALDILFGVGATTCTDACDVNGDFGFNIADAVSVLSFLFSAGPAPAAPFPDCGGPIELGCDSFPPCAP